MEIHRPALPSPVHEKVLIMGSASNGKTTLAKDLARFYDAPVSLEYAREYQIKNNVRDDELTPKDYYYLLLGQYDQTSKLIDSSAIEVWSSPIPIPW